jgi:adenosine deaminase
MIAVSRRHPCPRKAIVVKLQQKQFREANMKSLQTIRALRCWCASILFFALCATASAQTKTPAAPAKQTLAEQRTARALDSARATPPVLRAFLLRMPKGADLHNHLSGAVYAESWIRAAAEDRICINPAKTSFSKPQAPSTGGSETPVCGDGAVPAADAYKDQHLYDALVDAFSMRGFVPSPGVTGHDHFFDTFAKFGGTDHKHLGEWVDEVATRAAAQNEQYLELMHTPDFSHAAAMAAEIGWHEDFGAMRDALLARGLRDQVPAIGKELDAAQALRSQRERCGQQDESAACHVQVRFLYQILRGLPKLTVFAQTLLAFEAASADPDFVGINFVMPEDGYTSMNDYALHMRMVGFFHEAYPKIHIALHAGEITQGLVPYEGLCCHIRLAVEQAHAERIGHGVDIMYEDRPYDLLNEMAANHVMVEISLTSNDVILGVSGKDHPLPIYRKSGVPVALSTDDEGVSRIDLTHEYVRAVATYDLRYADLKQMVRTGIEHTFLSGSSLWREADVFSRPVDACSQDTLGGDKPSSKCAAFLKLSEKARQQWELERRLRAFEASN